MNLNDFDITTHSGLYISKDEHPIFGKKYIARFQYDKKRYVKVLGYEKRDNITLNKAISLIEKFKSSIQKNSHENETKDDKFEGKIYEYGMKEGGVGLTDFKFTREKIGEENIKKLEEIQKKIADGEIEIKSTR